MSADGSITLTWGDGVHRFRLAIGQLGELMENVNRPRVAIGAPLVGPNGLWRILVDNDGWPNDVREVLRLGLIGGGMTPQEAHALVTRYVDNRPLFESERTAFLVLAAGTAGVKDDPVGKPEEGTTAPPTEPIGSSSPASTVSAVH